MCTVTHTKGRNRGLGCMWRALLLAAVCSSWLLLLAILPRTIHHHRQPARQCRLYPAPGAGDRTVPWYVLLKESKASRQLEPSQQRAAAAAGCASPASCTSSPLPLVAGAPSTAVPNTETRAACHTTHIYQPHPASSPLALRLVLLGLVLLKLLVAHAPQRHVLVPPGPRLRLLRRRRRRRCHCRRRCLGCCLGCGCLWAARWRGRGRVQEVHRNEQLLQAACSLDSRRSQVRHPAEGSTDHGAAPARLACTEGLEATAEQ